jgi:urease accessory protein
MEIITTALSAPPNAVLEVPLAVDRLTLAKRRWRGKAEDGREFGFDLAAPLRDGVAFFHAGGTTYIISQKAEGVFEIPFTSPADGARVGWLIGNLHFSLEVTQSSVRVAEDSAIRQMLEREKIAYSEASRVFHPFHAAHAH